MIYNLIATLLEYGLKKNLIKEEDRVYFQNKLIEFLKLDDYKEAEPLDYSLEQLMDAFDDYAVEQGWIGNSVTERDLFDTRLISLLVDRPSNIIKEFYDRYNKDRKSATDYFYNNVSIDSNYVRKYRCDRDLKWVTPTKYGDIDITINLSKPEKDPKEIEKAKNMPKGAYPVCLLCKENEGYSGRINWPARGNIRIIPLQLGGEDFFMQYSPYSYYNEHCILLNKVHKPMIIETLTIRKLLDFVDFLPHYFIGSNADLPIVGGSILAHEHFQGGSYTFAMEKAQSIYDFEVKGVKASIINWPLSVIRLTGDDKDKLLEAFDHVFNKWLNYSDPEVGVLAYSGETRHNTITPIARRKNGHYELDLALRNNRTDEAHPLGIFHPHDEYHHIKKENIGLIEVMGLAVLPRRLKEEMEELKAALLNNEDLSKHEALVKHIDWVNKDIKGKYQLSKDNIDEVINKEIGITFMHVLEDAGVFKTDDNGIEHFKKFCNTL